MSQLPSNIDAEQGIISACLQWPETCDEVSIRGGISLFYNPAHRAIWSAIESMRSERIEVGLLTITAKLRESHKLESVGGPQAIAELFDDVASKAMLPDLLKMAMDAAKRRSVFALSESAIRDAKDHRQLRPLRCRHGEGGAPQATNEDSQAWPSNMLHTTIFGSQEDFESLLAGEAALGLASNKEARIRQRLLGREIYLKALCGGQGTDSLLLREIPLPFAAFFRSAHP